MWQVRISVGQFHLFGRIEFYASLHGTKMHHKITRGPDLAQDPDPTPS